MIKVEVMPVHCVPQELIQIVECEQTIRDEIRSGTWDSKGKSFIEFIVVRQCYQGCS